MRNGRIGKRFELQQNVVKCDVFSIGHLHCLGMVDFSYIHKEATQKRTIYLHIKHQTELLSVITESAQTFQAYVCQLDATVVAEQGTVRV